MAAVEEVFTAVGEVVFMVGAEVAVSTRTASAAAATMAVVREARSPAGIAVAPIAAVAAIAELMATVGEDTATIADTDTAGATDMVEDTATAAVGAMVATATAGQVISAWDSATTIRTITIPTTIPTPIRAVTTRQVTATTIVIRQRIRQPRTHRPTIHPLIILRPVRLRFIVSRPRNIKAPAASTNSVNRSAEAGNSGDRLSRRRIQKRAGWASFPQS